MKTCPNCNLQVNDTAHYCERCGYEFHGVTSAKDSDAGILNTKYPSEDTAGNSNADNAPQQISSYSIKQSGESNHSHNPHVNAIPYSRENRDSHKNVANDVGTFNGSNSLFKGFIALIIMFFVIGFICIFWASSRG